MLLVGERAGAFGIGQTVSADSHSLRHLFMTSLERAGVSPKMAQTLARHSDSRLTLGVYTHVELPDRFAAIESLPGPPGGHTPESMANSDRTDAA
jgi:integrase